MAFAAALLFFLFFWLVSMLGMLLGDCTGPGDQICFTRKDTGLKLLMGLGGAILVAAPFAEGHRRRLGSWLLSAGPFILVAVVMAWPM
ncbi:MAG: hypothetical protein V4574_09245 [Pseudomonadota bacterium]